MSVHSETAGGGLDLAQFHQVFFEEAGENLETMERLLLEVDVASADDETLNAIFRCAHSVKGGAATFGFADVAALTHKMETLLDKLRRHELTPTAEMIDALLQSGDALRGQLARHQAGGAGEEIDTEALLATFSALVAGESAPARAAAAPGSAAVVPASGVGTQAAAAPAEVAEAQEPLPEGHRALELVVGPMDDPGAADNLAELFSEIPDLGTIAPIDGGQQADGIRRFKVVTASSDDDLFDLFSFHVSREHLRLVPLGPRYGFYKNSPGAPTAPETYGFFDEPPSATAAGDAAPGTSAEQIQLPSSAPDAARSRPKPAAKSDKPSSADASTLRVSVERVDQLINLVGELVITQAMLAQTTAQLDPALNQQLTAGLADLERNTRDLQESVMSIRMIPMSVVFSRFPRMLRDLASKLGKKVDFVTQGEATELDKGLVEKITDPLTHLVRNSCDHGVEMPADRLAAGKPEHGTITLAASHQGGSIVIEVRDDGKGMSRAKLLAKARERGLHAPDTLTDSEVWMLIFEPGFSTADHVTDVSGRGVGMDVVKKNIAALGGTVEIESHEGTGMSVRVRLPLTLAIMDSMSVGVGGECYILPLSSVVESFQLTPDTIKTIGGGGQVVQVRDEYLPVTELEHVFGVPREWGERPEQIMVVVESEGSRMGLLVDELLGQQQVVVKNLESNYRKVDNVSGATIMGDGSVALIIDVASLVRRSRH